MPPPRRTGRHELRPAQEGVCASFDERTLLVETTVFDAADKPAHDRGGVHLTRYLYDDAGKQTGEADFDEHGRGIATKPAK